VNLQIFVIGLGVALLIVVIEVVRRRRLSEGYALLWIAVGIGGVLLGIARPLIDRFSDSLGVSYGANLAEATQVLDRTAREVADKDPLKSDITAKPEVLGVEKFTPEGITLRVTVKTRPGRQWAVQRNLRAQLMPALEEAGFTAK
jgi:hypothetical protein